MTSSQEAPTGSESSSDVTRRESLLRIGEYHLSLDDPTDDDAAATTISIATKAKFQDAIRGAAQFKRGESATILKVLEEIDNIALKRTTEGFNELNFSVGVMNCLLISFTFGAFPEHLWILFLIESMYMIPRKFYNMWHAKPLNQALYYLDFCWCMNFTGIVFLVALVLSKILGGMTIEESTREKFLDAALGVSCGTLMGANITLPFVACLFHDVNTMTGLFIHIMPPMVMYTFMWHHAEIKEAWPSVFNLAYMEEIHYFPKAGPFFAPGSGLDSVVGNSVALYLAWWIPYVCFMLLGGIDLPKKVQPDGITPANPTYDTVFHSTMRGGVCISIGKIFRGRSKVDSLKQMEENRFDLVDFFIYMAFHMIASIAAVYVIGYPCFSSQKFHLFMLVVVTTLAVTRGASRYTYYSTKMYSNSLRRQFASALDSSKES